MRKIRNNVFETNSSSTHSVSISSSSSMFDPNCLTVSEDNYVHVSFGEFGWEIENYSDPYSKLQYILTMMMETEEERVSTFEELCETEAFKAINDAVASYCNCSGIRIDSRIKLETYEYNNKVYKHMMHDGYIDHQSCENYKDINDFLSDWGVSSIEEFVFSTGVTLHTDNDNH